MMKNIKSLQLDLLLLVSLLVFNCKNGTDNNIELNQNTETWYQNLFESKKAELGLEDVSYYQSNFNFNEVKHLSHEEIIEGMDAFLKESKKFSDSFNNSRMEKINQLISIIKKNKLENKELFYKKLLEASSAKEKMMLYYNEEIAIGEKFNAVTKKGDSKEIEKMLQEISYLDIIKDKNSNALTITKYSSN